MNKTDWLRLGKYLLQQLPNFKQRNDLLFQIPVGHALCGILFERSSNKDHCYVWQFVIPLFVPTNDITLSFGERLRDGQGFEFWDASDDNMEKKLLAAIQSHALPFFVSASSLQQLVTLLRQMAQTGDPYRREAYAYALVLLGDELSSKREIARLIASLSQDASQSWRSKIRERAELIAGLLLNDPTGARRQLLEWEELSLKHFELNAFGRGNGPGNISDSN